jgi:hypothetical protein
MKIVWKLDLWVLLHYVTVTLWGEQRGFSREVREYGDFDVKFGQMSPCCVNNHREEEGEARLILLRILLPTTFS